MAVNGNVEVGGKTYIAVAGGLNISGSVITPLPGANLASPTDGQLQVTNQAGTNGALIFGPATAAGAGLEFFSAGTLQIVGGGGSLSTYGVGRGAAWLANNNNAVGFGNLNSTAYGLGFADNTHTTIYANGSQSINIDSISNAIFAGNFVKATTFQATQNVAGFLNANAPSYGLGFSDNLHTTIYANGSASINIDNASNVTLTGALIFGTASSAGAMLTANGTALSFLRGDGSSLSVNLSVPNGISTNQFLGTNRSVVSYGFSGQTTYGLGFADTSHVGIYANGSASLSIDSASNAWHSGNVFVSGTVNVSSSAKIGWTSRANLSSPADGQLLVAFNNGTTDTGAQLLLGTADTNGLSLFLNSSGYLSVVDGTGNTFKNIRASAFVANNNGTAASPSFQNSAGNNAGLYFPTATTVGLSSNSTASLIFDNNANATFGGSINTTSNMRANQGYGTQQTAGAAFYNTNAITYGFGFSDNAHTTIYANASASLTFDASQNAWFTGSSVNFSGSVNISSSLTVSSSITTLKVIATNAYVSSPNFFGQINGTAANPVFANLGVSNAGLYFPTTTTVGLSSNGTASLTFDTSQVAYFSSSIVLSSGSNVSSVGLAGAGGVFTITGGGFSGRQPVDALSYRSNSALAFVNTSATTYGFGFSDNLHATIFSNGSASINIDNAANVTFSGSFVQFANNGPILSSSLSGGLNIISSGGAGFLQIGPNNANGGGLFYNGSNQLRVAQNNNSTLDADFRASHLYASGINGAAAPSFANINATTYGLTFTDATHTGLATAGKIAFNIDQNQNSWLTASLAVSGTIICSGALVIGSSGSANGVQLASLGTNQLNVTTATGGALVVNANTFQAVQLNLNQGGGASPINGGVHGLLIFGGGTNNNQGGIQFPGTGAGQYVFIYANATASIILDSSANVFLTGNLNAIGGISGNTNNTVGQGLLIGSPGNAFPAGLVYQSQGVLQQRGSVALPVQTPVSQYIVQTGSDFVILCDATSGSFGVVLPASPFPGTQYIVKKIDGTGNAVIVSGTIDGAVNASLTTKSSLTVLFSGTGYFIL